MHVGLPQGPEASQGFCGKARKRLKASVAPTALKSLSGDRYGRAAPRATASEDLERVTVRNSSPHSPACVAEERCSRHLAGLPLLVRSRRNSSSGCPGVAQSLLALHSHAGITKAGRAHEGSGG